MKIPFLIFTFIFIGIYFLMNCYLYLRIIYGFDFSWKNKKRFRFILILFALPFFIDRLLSGFFFVYPLSYFGMVWLGLLTIACCVFLIKDIIGLFLPFKRKELTWLAIIMSLILTFYGMIKIFLPIPVKEIVITNSKIPKALSGFSIVQLTDIHLDRLKTIEWTEQLVSQVNSLNPDLIVITGDFNDLKNMPALEKFVPVFRNLKSKYGIFAVPGNHEYYSNIHYFNEFCHQTNIHILTNENITVADHIELSGIIDPAAKDFNFSEPDLKKTIYATDKNKFKIFLSHRPYYFKEASDAGVFLQLSGHTHAGQIPPMALLVYFVYQYPHGLYQINNSYLYVSPGTGYWGPPMRLFSKSEITRIVFK